MPRKNIGKGAFIITTFLSIIHGNPDTGELEISHFCTRCWKTES